VVFAHSRIVLLGQVAVQAGNVGLGVLTVGPVREEPRVLLLVALDAGLGLLGYLAGNLELFFLQLIALLHAFGATLGVSQGSQSSESYQSE